MKLLAVTITQRVGTAGLLFLVLTVIAITASLAAGLITVVLPPKVASALALANDLAAWTRLGLAVVLAAWVISHRETE